MIRSVRAWCINNKPGMPVVCGIAVTGGDPRAFLYTVQLPVDAWSSAVS